MHVQSARLEGDTLILTVAPYEARRFVYDFKPGEYEIKKTRKKRSLNANAYAWELIGQIGDVLRISKDEVYLDMLKSYGQSHVVSVRSEIDVSGYFRYYEAAGETTLNGKRFTHYRVYKGSSEYDTREMSVLIDGIVQEAKQLDIETLTPLELERLKDAWTDKGTGDTSRGKETSSGAGQY